MEEGQIVEEHKGVQVVRVSDGYRLICPDGDYFDRSYDEITFDPVKEVFICRKNRDFDSFFLSTMKSGRSSRCTSGDEITVDGVCDFYRGGKFGCRIDGKEILPPVYDDICKWPDCDVIYTRKGMDIRYFDLNGNEILKKRRAIAGEADHLEPYYFDEPQDTDIVQTMDLCERPEGEDFCVCYGRRAGLSRRTRREHMDWIEAQGAEVCKRFRENTLFAWDCYIYSAYKIQSAAGAKRPVADCLRRLEKFGIFDVSWHIILTILVPRRGFQRRITKEELKAIRELQRRETGNLPARVPKYLKKQDRTDCGRADNITVVAIYKGITDRIERGAIVMVTRCFADHWPTPEEYRKMKEKQKRIERRKKKRKFSSLWW